MSLLVSNLMRTAAYPISERFLMQTAAKRWFSGASNSGVNSFIGPAPSQPARPGELGYDVFIKSMKFSLQHDQGSIFSHADIEKIKLPPREHSIFISLINEIKAQNAEMRTLNKNMADLLTVIASKK